MFAAPRASALVALGVLALLLVSAPLSAAPMKWTLGGYLQTRLTEDLGSPASGAATPSTFLDTRPSVLIRATDDQHVFLQMFFSMRSGTGLEVQHAFAEYRAAPWAARLGLGPVPFGYENPVTSAALITTERSQASARLIGTFALDRGAQVIYKNPNGFNAAVGAFNGQPYTVSSDTNSNKTLAGRIGYLLPKGKGDIGLSLYDGAGTGATNPIDVQRMAVDVLYKPANFTILGEYFTGEGDIINNVADVKGKGGYLTVAYRKPGSAFMPYLRVDTFDPNDDVDNDTFDRITGGVSYYLNETSKVQAEFESINDDLNPDLDGRYTLQYQIIY